jgi:hypothetical protein
MENENKKTKAIIPMIRSYELAKPAQMKQMAVVLRDFIAKNELSLVIAGRPYIFVEGWQFAGGLMGLTPRITEVRELGPDRWLAKAELYDRSGKLVATGFASCSKEEYKKKSFDEYAILSMAQTRAIGKAYRTVIGWVVKMAGFEATPAEESASVGNQPNKPTPPRTAPTINETIASIRNSGDQLTLANTRERVKNSKIYNENQKRLILQAISERLAELQGIKTIQQ